MIRYIIFIVLFVPVLVTAADLSRELRIAEQIEEAIFDGEVLRLADGDHKFLAVYRRSDADTVRGAAIILHGRGAHPEWTDVVRPLASRLPESGWDTLAIQLPVAAAAAPDRDWDALVPEAIPRINAAIAFLSERRVTNIVLVAHSMGARMGAHFLAAGSPPAVRALVAVGLSVHDRDRDSGSLANLRQIKLPVLDIYGERDLSDVLNSTKDRRLAARDAGNTGYEQVRVPGADHFFAGLDDLLVSRVSAWMVKVAATAGVPNRR